MIHFIKLLSLTALYIKMYFIMIKIFTLMTYESYLDANTRK